MTTEAFTFGELDEMGGAFLFVGGFHRSLMQLLDVTRDSKDMDLFEFVNHAPEGIALALLATTQVAITEVVSRLEAAGKAVASAVESAVTRIESGEAGTKAEFDAIVKAEFVDEAKKNGKDLP